MSVALDQPICRPDVEALFTIANGLLNVQGRPFTVIQTWSYRVAFGFNSLVSFDGEYFRCQIPNLGVPPTNALYWQKVTLNATGPWSATTTYAIGDTVTQSGWTFICTNPGLNNPPLVTVGDTTTANGGWVQNWLNGYNRMRTAVQTLLQNGFFATSGRGILYPWQTSISGGATDDGNIGWPCQSPNVLYNHQWFYYADTGGTVTVTVSAPVQASNHWTTLGTSHCQTFYYGIVNTANPPGMLDTAFITSIKSEIIIGGDQPVTVQANFWIAAQLVQSGWQWLVQTGVGGAQFAGEGFWSDGGDPSTLCTLDTTNWIPGATFTKVIVPANPTLSIPAYCCYCCTINGTVNPGRYGVTMTGGLAGDDSISNTWTPVPGHGAPSGSLYKETISAKAIFGDSDSCGLFAQGLTDGPAVGPGLGAAGAGVMFLANSTAIETHGIHNSKKVYKNRVPGFNSTTGLPFGFYYVNAAATETDGQPYPQPSPFPNYTTGNTNHLQVTWQWQAPPFPQPVFDGVVITGPVGTVSITANTDGFWFGMTPPINSGGMDGLQPFMQWNSFHWNSAGNVDSTALVPYTGGRYNTGSNPAQAYNQADSSWERQPMPCLWKPGVFYPAGFTIQDSNGNLQTVVAAGRSGATEPNWPPGVGQTTQEPTFYYGSVNQAGVLWQLTVPLSPAPVPAPSRRYSIVRYPFFWQPDLLVTDASLKARLVPDMTQVGYGNVNGAVSSPSVYGWWIYRVYLNRISPAAGPVPVTLGCIRNGSFTAFGTYNTGQVVNAMWPVFTSTALCYQCTERVDVQAIILTCGLGYSTWGSVGYPIMLAYWADLQTLFNLTAANPDGSPGTTPALPGEFGFNAGSNFNTESGF